MKLYSTGSNSNGQLSNSTLLDTSKFNPVQFNSTSSSTSSFNFKKKKILDLKFGGTHTLLLSTSTTRGEVDGEDGKEKEVWVVGCNDFGQLGLPLLEKTKEEDNNNNYTKFTLLPIELLLSTIYTLNSSSSIPTLNSFSLNSNEFKIESITTSWETSFINLKNQIQHENDLLLSFGNNDWGELGIGIKGSKLLNGTLTNKKIWKVPLEDLISIKDKTTSYIKIKSIHSGPRHIILNLLIHSTTSSSSIIINKLFGWGISRKGQLGNKLINSKILLLPTLIELPFLMKDLNELVIGRDHTAFSIKQGKEIIIWGHLKSINNISSIINVDSLNINKEDNELQLQERRINQLKSTWSGIYFSTTSTSSTNPSSSIPTKSIYALGSNTHGQLASPPPPPPPSSSSIITTRTKESPPPSQPNLIPLPNHLKILKLITGSEHILILCSTTSNNPTTTINSTSNLSNQNQTTQEREREVEKKEKKELWGWGWNEHGNLGISTLIDLWLPECIWREGQSFLPTERAEEEKEGEREGEGEGEIKVWGGNGTSWIYC